MSRACSNQDIVALINMHNVGTTDTTVYIAVGIEVYSVNSIVIHN